MRLFAEPIPVRLVWCEGELTGLRVGNARLLVVEVVRRWRVEMEWWKDAGAGTPGVGAPGTEGTTEGTSGATARDYLTLRTADGWLCEVYGDRRSGEWFLQRLMD